MSNISKDKEHFGNMSKMEVARLKKSLRNYFRKVNVSIFEYIPALIMGLMLFQLILKRSVWLPKNQLPAHNQQGKIQLRKFLPLRLR